VPVQARPWRRSSISSVEVAHEERLSGFPTNLGATQRCYAVVSHDDVAGRNCLVEKSDALGSPVNTRIEVSMTEKSVSACSSLPSTVSAGTTAVPQKLNPDFGARAVDQTRLGFSACRPPGKAEHPAGFAL